MAPRRFNIKGGLQPQGIVKLPLGDQLLTKETMKTEILNRNIQTQIVRIYSPEKMFRLSLCRWSGPIPRPRPCTRG